MSLTETIVTNFLCSFFSALIFIYFILWLYKPRVKISNLISKRVDDFDMLGKTYYSFKLVNQSAFKAFDVIVQLNEVISFPAEDGKRHNRYKRLELRTDRFTFLSRKKWEWLYPKYTDHCLIFRTYENISVVLSDQIKSLQIEITLRHGLTGITGVYTQDFVDEYCIKEGVFKAGNNYDINIK